MATALSRIVRMVGPSKATIDDVRDRLITALPIRDIKR